MVCAESVCVCGMCVLCIGLAVCCAVSLCVVLVLVLVCNLWCVVSVCGVVWHAQTLCVEVQNVSVCRLKTLPCVPARRAHGRSVIVHRAPKVIVGVCEVNGKIGEEVDKASVT